MSKKCEHIFRKARQIVGKRFYDYLICDLCGRLSLPGTQVVSIRGVDKAMSDKLRSMLKEGFEVFSESHGTVTHYTLVSPSALGKSIV